MYESAAPTTEHPPFNPDHAASRFIALTAAKRDLDAQKKKVQDELNTLTGVLLHHFEQHNKQAETRDGYTIYRQRELTIKSRSGDTSDVVAKLRRARLGELIGINHPRMKSWIKERLMNDATGTWEIDDSKLPPTIREVVQIDEFYKLGCRKASS